MKWKNFPAWLKGGIIGFFIGVLGLLGSYLYQLWIEHTKPIMGISAAVIEKLSIIKFLMLFLFIPFIIVDSILFSNRSGNRNLLIIILLGLIIYFILGAFIGWIINKINSCKNR